MKSSNTQSEGKKEKRLRAKLLSLRYLVLDSGRVIAGPFVLLYFRPKFYYENAAARRKLRGNALVIANHPGQFDCVKLLVAVWYRRLHIIATKDIFERSKFANWFYTQCQCIKVDKDNFNYDTFLTVQERLAGGCVVGLFPEGQVSVSDEGVSAFKSGVTLMAMKSGAPVQPIYIAERKSVFQRLRIAVGEPIHVDELSKDKPAMLAIQEATQKIREKELELKKLIDTERQEN